MQNYGGFLEDFDMEISHDFPVEIRRPRYLPKTPADKLHLAVWQSDHERIRDLIVRKGFPVDSLNSLGQTPLFVAACMSKPAVVTQLLHSGADPNFRCQGGYTPVHAACFSGSRRTISNMLKFGGDLGIHDTNRKIPADWVEYQRDETRRQRSYAVLESFRLNELKSCKHSNENLMTGFNGEEKSKEAHIRHTNLSKKRAGRYKMRDLSQRDKLKVKVLTDNFLKTMKENGARPGSSYELNADKDLSDFEILNDSFSDDSDEETLEDIPKFSSLDEPDYTSRRFKERLKRSWSLQENRNSKTFSGNSEGVAFRRASDSSLQTSELSRPVKDENHLNFFLFKKDDFDLNPRNTVPKEKINERKWVSSEQAIGQSITTKYSLWGRKHGSALPQIEAERKSKIKFVAPKFSSQAASHLKPPPVKNIPNPTTGLTNFMERILKNKQIYQDSNCAYVQKKPIPKNLIPRDAKPSGLVFSAERYAESKQTFQPGNRKFQSELEEPEQNIQKSRPSFTTRPDKDQILYAKPEGPIHTNGVGDDEYRSIIEILKCRTNNAASLKSKTLPSLVFPDVLCGTPNSEPRPTIKPASHFTEARGAKVLSNPTQISKVHRKRIPGLGFSVANVNQNVGPRANNQVFNFEATRAVFESLRADQLVSENFFKAPRKFHTRIDSKTNVLKPMARKAPPQPPPKPNPDSQELAFHFNTKFDCMPNVFQTSTPSRPSIGEKRNLFVHGSKYIGDPNKICFNTLQGDETLNDLGSSIDYHTANSTPLMGAELDISLIPTSQSPPPRFKVHNRKMKNQIVSSTNAMADLTIKSRKSNVASIVDVTASLAQGKEIHFDPKVKRTSVLEKAAKIEGGNIFSSFNEWAAEDPNQKNECEPLDANSEEECWTFPQPPLNEEINWLETEGQQLNGSFLEEENHIEDYPIETNNMATGDPSNDNLWLNDEVEIESQNPEGIQHETMEKIKDLCLSDDLGFNHQQDYETVQEDYDEVDFNPGDVESQSSITNTNWETLDVEKESPFNDRQEYDEQNPTDDQYFDDQLEKDCVFEEAHLNLVGDRSFGFDGPTQIEDSTEWNLPTNE